MTFVKALVRDRAVRCGGIDLMVLVDKDLVQTMLNHGKLLQRLLEIHGIELSKIFLPSSGWCSSGGGQVHLLLSIPEFNLSLVEYPQSLLNAFALVLCLIQLLVLLQGYH